MVRHENSIALKRSLAVLTAIRCTGMIVENPAPRRRPPLSMRAVAGTYGRLRHGSDLEISCRVAHFLRCFAADGGAPPRVRASDRRGPAALVGPLSGYRGGVDPVPVRISNLTPAGCLIESPEPEQVGLRMQLEIALPEDGWIHVNAEVSNVLGGCGYVVQFLDPSPETLERIERAIQQ